MRTRLLAAAALLLAAVQVSAADPPLPPVVFQVQPVGRVFDDLRTAAKIVGGEKVAEAVNKGLKNAFGEKGLDGLDLNRPVVGYVVLAAKPEDITAVVALPVIGEKEFLDLCERLNGSRPKADDKDKALYHLPAPGPKHKAVMRFSEQYAYIACGADPAPHVDAKALVPMPKLFDPAERGLFAARVYFDRIPVEAKRAVAALFDEVKKNPPRGIGIGKQEMELLKPAGEGIEKLLARYVKLSEGAEVLTVRVVFDRQAASLAAEAVLTPKPNTELAKIIAARKPTQNRFAGLGTHPDTVAAFRLRLPLFEEELKSAAESGLESLRKQAANAPDALKGSLDELLKGFIRTVKTEEFDVAIGVRGPDKDGYFTAVGAVAFEDPAALEKEFRKFVDGQAPAEVKEGLKWDAAKAGTVSIHTLKIPGNGWVGGAKVFGGDSTTVAFAFAPHGIFAAIGPDPVAALKDAIPAKPADAPVLDIAMNPARVRKLIRKMAPNDAEAARVEELFGKEDKLGSILAVSLEGGKELKAKVALDLQGFPRLIAQWLAVEYSARPEPPVPEVEKK